jgi:hypothetical protein
MQDTVDLMGFRTTAAFTLTRRFAWITALPLFLTGCAAPLSLPQQDREVTTYYDRNHDGVVDFELHETPGVADAGWALSDTKFDGRYDVRLKFGYVFSRERIDKAVPKNVSITKGKPPVFATQ